MLFLLSPESDGTVVCDYKSHVFLKIENTFLESNRSQVKCIVSICGERKRSKKYWVSREHVYTGKVRVDKMNTLLENFGSFLSTWSSVQDAILLCSLLLLYFYI